LERSSSGYQQKASIGSASPKATQAAVDPTAAPTRPMVQPTETASRIAPDPTSPTPTETDRVWAIVPTGCATTLAATTPAMVVAP
jgi:hypothetical protein